MKNYEFSNATPQILAKVKTLMDSNKAGFTEEAFKAVSKPAGALCNWVINWYQAGMAVKDVGRV